MTDKNYTDFLEKETLLTFPCEFPIKIMGKAHEDLHAAVLEILAEHAPEFSASTLIIKPSKDGNYHALTATIRAESKKQLDLIYHALTAHHLVLMAL
jgi:putative lipoic acid-binding regulatory protein